MNHMKETPEFWEQVFSHLSQYKEQGAAAGLAGTVAILRGMYNGGGWKKTLLDGALCAFFGWFAKDLLAAMGMNPEFAYFTSVLIGYWGVETLSKMIKGKAGVNND
ncbi:MULTISPECIES: phage holin, lambda family [unclassified Providencia]|uniref:phage holin, lambda family n=1 Tax=unclassified Providencia TaxID=2633465 RepID=UPI0012B5785E|nr:MULTISPECIES: phage holin, lambda family [unclassified Providencia]MTC24911.1 phage holin, lambda family [Providencia sp. wls1938]